MQTNAEVDNNLILFGPRWNAPVDEAARYVDTPTHLPCSGGCEDVIREGDQGIMLLHYEPLARELREVTGFGPDAGLRTVMGPEEWTVTLKPWHRACYLRHLGILELIP